MMKFTIIFAAVCLLSCVENENTEGNDTVHSGAKDTIVTNAQPFVIDGCYEMVSNGDTATMNLTLKDSIVSGPLNFHWRAKDWNDGFIKGVLRDDMIYADYTYKSEGLTSVREVIFKIDNGMLVQGDGELKDANGKWIFADMDDIRFEKIYPFVKVDCEQ